MALDIFTQFATDETLENNGTWFEIGGGAKLLIARSGNKAYTKALSKEVERYKQVLDRGDDAADQKSEQIMLGVLANTILLGWENVNYKGRSLEYNTANAQMLLGMKDFRRMVVRLSDDIEGFRMKEEQAQGGA